MDEETCEFCGANISRIYARQATDDFGPVSNLDTGSSNYLEDGSFRKSRPWLLMLIIAGALIACYMNFDFYRTIKRNHLDTSNLRVQRMNVNGAVTTGVTEMAGDEAIQDEETTPMTSEDFRQLLRQKATTESATIRNKDGQREVFQARQEAKQFLHGIQENQPKPQVVSEPTIKAAQEAGH
jgi:hypothetical protein